MHNDARIPYRWMTSRFIASLRGPLDSYDPCATLLRWDEARHGQHEVHATRAWTLTREEP